MKQILVCLLACLAWTSHMHAENPAEPEKPAKEAKPEAASPTGTWNLVVKAAGKEDTNGQTLVFDAEKKRVSGFAGVNRFFGGYQQDGATLKMGPLASTRMGGPQEKMAEESAYLGMLQKATQWRIKDGKLELLDGEEVLATFSKAP